MKRFLLGCLMVAGLSWAGEKPHPSLVDPATAKCETCHAEMLKGKVHPVLDAGCDNCHTFAKKEGKLFVGLSAEGNDLCAQCHEEQAKRASLPKPHMPIDNCSTCHVPHASEQAPLLSSALPDLCLGCHDKEEIKKKHKDQPIQGTTCVVCHDPHGNEKPHFLSGKVMHPPFGEGSCESCHRKTRTKQIRLISPVPDLCYACHSGLEKAFLGASVHKPVREGKCTQCHDPHQAGQAHLVKESSPKLCYGCHTEVEALVKAKAHSPAKGDCGSCHGVHATNRPHLILDAMMEGSRISSLCAQCHDLKPLMPKHRGAAMEGLDCTSCHNPHGSKSPKLLNAGSVHPVYDDCSNCHSDGTALAQEPPDLCYACHDQVKEEIAKAKVPHPAVDAGCTSCHSPHAAPQPRLLKSAGPALCADCHSDIAQGMTDAPYLHGVVRTQGCQACHTLHGGALPKLLKAKPPDLCLGCHGVGAKGGAPKIALSKDGKKDHPVKGHPVDPGGRSCLGCHDPHMGRSPKLFAGLKTTETELCAVCHQ